MKNFKNNIFFGSLISLFGCIVLACSSDINEKPAGDCWWVQNSTAICYSHGYKSEGFNDSKNAGIHFNIKAAKQSDGHYVPLLTLTPVSVENQYCKSATDASCKVKIVIENKEYHGNLSPEFVGNGTVLTQYNIDDLTPDIKDFMSTISEATTFNVVLFDNENKEHPFKLTAKKPLQSNSDKSFDWKSFQ